MSYRQKTRIDNRKLKLNYIWFIQTQRPLNICLQQERIDNKLLNKLNFFGK